MDCEFGTAAAQADAVRSIDGCEACVIAACAADANAAAHRQATDLVTCPPSQRVQAIIRRTADRHGVSVDDIIGRKRHPHIVSARYEAIRLVNRVFPHFSTPHLGTIFGNRDHTSILWALGRTAKSRAVA